MTHAKRLIAQLRENAENEHVPEEIQERNAERADELEAEVEEDGDA